MKSSVTKEFRRRLDRLPTAVQDQAVRAYALWRSNPYHNSLQFKRISQRQPIYSVCIGIGYQRWACWKQIIFTGSGLVRMLSMMNCSNGFRARRLVRNEPQHFPVRDYIRIPSSSQRSCHLALIPPWMKVHYRPEEHLPKAAVGMVVRLRSQQEPVVLTGTPDCCP